MNNPTPSPAISVTWEGEEIIVSNVERELPAASTGDDRADVVAAGASNPMTPLPADAWHAVARAVVTPAVVATQLRPSKNAPSGLLQEEHVEGATLRSVISRAWLLELFPGIQPRTGMEAMETADPQVEGVVDQGEPTTLLRYRYKSLEELKNHVWQTIKGTLSLNNYTPSIVGRKVTRALITHPVEFSFEDGTESIYALAVRDGITRLASAWQVLAGPGASANDAATTATEALFGTVSHPSAGGKPLTQRMAASREARRRQLGTEFIKDWSGITPGVRAIQVAQTYVVPVQVAVGVQRHMNGPALAPEDLFDDAMRSILASVHLEFREWNPSAQNVEVATRALKRVMQLGLGGNKEDLRVFYGLAVGRTSPEDLPKEYDNDEIPGTALWRAIYLVHALTHPDLFEPLKDQAKAIKGERRMSEKGFGGLLGPIIDLPWRSAKHDVLKQARNAWANGGVLAKDLLGAAWNPVPTADFTTLVEPARQGDVNARMTLAVAGGVALIADKLLTRNVGSALMAPKEKGGVPFRADVNDVVGNLADQGNELGLWTLALAAQRFEAGRLPQNSATVRQITRKQGVASAQVNDYVHVLVDLSKSDRIARDDAGKAIPLTQWDVVFASDEDRANQEIGRRAHPNSTYGVGSQSIVVTPANNEASGEGTSESEQSEEIVIPRPAAQRAADEHRALKIALDDARHALDELNGLEPELGTFPPLFTVEELKPLHAVAQDVKHELYQRLKAAQEAQLQEEEAAAEEDSEEEDGDS